MKKSGNKARFHTDKNTQTRRQKVDYSRYINIRQTWGAPKQAAPKKSSAREGEKERKRLKRTEEETLTRRVVARVIEGEETSWI